MATAAAASTAAEEDNLVRKHDDGKNNLRFFKWDIWFLVMEFIGPPRLVVPVFSLAIRSCSEQVNHEVRRLTKVHGFKWRIQLKQKALAYFDVHKAISTSQILRSDIQAALIALILCDDADLLSLFDDRVRGNADVVMIAIARQGLAPRHRYELSFVSESVLKYADPKLQATADVVLAAVRKEGLHFNLLIRSFEPTPMWCLLLYATTVSRFDMLIQSFKPT